MQSLLDRSKILKPLREAVPSIISTANPEIIFPQLTGQKKETATLRKDTLGKEWPWPQKRESAESKPDKLAPTVLA